MDRSTRPWPLSPPSTPSGRARLNFLAKPAYLASKISSVYNSPIAAIKRGWALSEILLVNFGARWNEPVHIVEKRKVESINGPADAIRHMRDKFRDKTGPAYSRAVNICYAALRREADPDISRVFFLTAYEDYLSKIRPSG
ncbi:DUF982 domain-containing protein [Pseudorhizobium endolithicum]|uniref:DUF982 domain-containing protein n=1 Tax=Pseudorhizobium endolithicum TaxID=1191678 RepID=UPI0038B5C8C0